MDEEPALADDLFCETSRTNGVILGVPGRYAGYKSDGRVSPISPQASVGMFSGGDRIMIRLGVRGTHTRSYEGAAAGKAAVMSDIGGRRFKDGKLVEISRCRISFRFLKQIDYLPDESVRRNASSLTTRQRPQGADLPEG
jgi:hypothetical protein